MSLVAVDASGVSGERGRRPRLALALAALLSLAPAACSTKPATLPLYVDAIAAPDGKRVVLLGTGLSCDDVRVRVASRKGDTFTLSGKGTVPMKRGDYCARYIDTGGENMSRKTGRVSVKVDEGQYRVRAELGGDSITFLFRDGVVATHRLGKGRSIEEVATALAGQRDATVRAADRLTSLLPGWTRGACEQDPQRGHAVVCLLNSAPGYGTDGMPSAPLPADAVSGLGCVETKTAYGQITCRLGNVSFHAEVKSHEYKTGVTTIGISSSTPDQAGRLPPR